MSSSQKRAPSATVVPVELNVYDLLHPDNPDAVPNINWYLYGLGMGLYHSGVSIYGTEYCYGGHPDDHTGVFEVVPRKAPDAKFRQTILVGKTSLDPQQVSELVNAMAQVWTGNSYNLLTRNCNHFASDLCERLTGTPAPEWVNRLAWVGEKAKFLLPKGFDTPTAAPVTAQAAAEARAAEERYSDVLSIDMAELRPADDSNGGRDPDHSD